MPKTLESDLTFAGVQDPRASNHLHQANPNMHMDSLLYMKTCKHSVISSGASCVCVSHKSPIERPWRKTPWVSDRPSGLAGWICAMMAWCVLHQWLINIEFSLVHRWVGKRRGDETDKQLKCAFMNGSKLKVEFRSSWISNNLLTQRCWEQGLKGHNPAGFSHLSGEKHVLTCPGESRFLPG